ncbi:MAG TPA: crosslink repair DNA glycosylase YcaQ family protein [Acidimicrobiia bacterium]|nr:crosslink repair DNA glycosylase YcaQ family protein [Acidimicrobiia bacterium]
MTGEVAELCHRAIAHTLFPPTVLAQAIDRLSFVQADPIRAPARAQDLILRHRVLGYRVGDLDREYAALDVEEDVLYAYGFMPRRVSAWLRPRGGLDALGDLERKVLAVLGDRGPMHPAELATQFGRERVVNAWGGYSKATKDALERLHYRGLLRIARRDNGIRVYEVAPPRPDDVSPEERLRRLLVVVCNVLAPVQERTLQAVAAQLRRHLAGTPGHKDARRVLRGLLDSGELERQTVDGVAYVSPVPGPAPEDAPARVRFLAPFDPLVWDRRRFEHLWQWPYRFEAYTPAAKRVRGYYALPVLWRDRVVGWANAAIAGVELQVDLGFVNARPTDAGFEDEAEAEASRLAVFLGLDETAVIVR